MVKKILIGLAVMVVLAGAFSAAGYVYAQSTQPPTQGYGPGKWQGGWGGGMMGRRGQGGIGLGMMGYGQYGVMHEAMIAAVAEKLGMTVEDLNARLAKGETMYQIAQEKGLTSAQFATLMDEARDQALDQMVAKGLLTAEQAQWMKEHMDQMNGFGFGGGCMWGGYPTATPGTNSGISSSSF